MQTWKTAIVYFSQTNNTQKIARAIGRGIGSTGNNYNLFRFVRAKDIHTEDLSGYDLIGFGCPTWIYREPFNVTQFVKRLAPLAGKHAFVFTTCGGHPGNTLPSMAQQLESRELTVIGGLSIDGQVTAPPLSPYPGVTHGHPDERDLEDAEHFGKQIVERFTQVSQGKQLDIQDFKWLDDELYTTVPQQQPKSKDFMMNMTWDSEKCRYPTCTLCMDNCPMNAIDISSSPVKWRQGCISCYFCEAICPYEAINYEYESLEEMATFSGNLKIKNKYPEFFERAKTELIENRNTLYRSLAGKIDYVNVETLAFKINKQRPRFKIDEE